MSKETTTWREKGNSLYTEATGPASVGKHALWKIRNLEQALQNYSTGKTTQSLAESSKCARSIGIVNAKLATDPDLRSSIDHARLLYHYKESLINFCYSLNYAPNGSDEEWILGVKVKIFELIDSFYKYIMDYTAVWQQRCGIISKASSLEPKDAGTLKEFINFFVNLIVANEIQKQFIKADEEGDWCHALMMTSEIEYHLSVCESSLKSSHFRDVDYTTFSGDRYTDLESLKTSRIYYSVRSRSAQHCQIGNDLKEQLLFEEENFNMDLAYLCLDNFTAAILYLREDGEDPTYLCYESAAKISSIIGEIFSQIFKFDDKAHQYHMHCIQYADIVTHASGSTFFNKEWYKSAKQAIEEYRKRKEAYDRREVEKQRAPIMEKIKPQLDAFKVAMDKFQGQDYRTHAFLLHIYKEHPPKNGKTIDENLDRDSRESLKKACLRAVTNYHPDLQANKTNGIEWQILCEEITKVLNPLYERFKG